MCSSALTPEGEERGRNRKYISAERAMNIGGHRRGGRCKRDIKFRVIRHNTCVIISYCTTFISPFITKPWEGTKAEARLPLLWKAALLLGSSVGCFPLTLLYLKQPVWHSTWLNLSEAKLRHSTRWRGERAGDTERAALWQRVHGWLLNVVLMRTRSDKFTGIEMSCRKKQGSKDGFGLSPVNLLSNLFRFYIRERITQVFLWSQSYIYFYSQVLG